MVMYLFLLWTWHFLLHIMDHHPVRAPLRRSFSDHIRNSTTRALDAIWKTTRDRRLAGEGGVTGNYFNHPGGCVPKDWKEVLLTVGENITLSQTKLYISTSLFPPEPYWLFLHQHKIAIVIFFFLLLKRTSRFQSLCPLLLSQQCEVKHFYPSGKSGSWAAPLACFGDCLRGCFLTQGEVLVFWQGGEKLLAFSLAELSLLRGPSTCGPGQCRGLGIETESNTLTTLIWFAVLKMARPVSCVPLRRFVLFLYFLTFLKLTCKLYCCSFQFLKSCHNIWKNLKKVGVVPHMVGESWVYDPEQSGSTSASRKWGWW